MKFLIYGAGTIGLTYAWLLSSRQDVKALVKPEKISAQNTFNFVVHDLRKKPAQKSNFLYSPCVTADISGDYDVILVMVNRYQLKDILPNLQNSTADIIFMQNHWDIQNEISPYLEPRQYLIGFPAQAGGGCEDNNIEVNIYNEGTVLGEVDGRTSDRLIKYKQAFEFAGLTVTINSDILGWLKVHYLQQSVSAGAILKAGGYLEFAESYQALKEMVYAFREGIAVCKACGVNTKNIFPAKLFKYPAPLVAIALKNMFKQPHTVRMVTGHMKHGLREWITGFNEVLKSGEEKNISMPVWESYKPFIEKYGA